MLFEFSSDYCFTKHKCPINKHKCPINIYESGFVYTGWKSECYTNCSSIKLNETLVVLQTRDTMG